MYTDYTCTISPGTELVLLGTGAKMVPVHRDIKDYLKSKGIALEVQDTVSKKLLYTTSHHCILIA